MYSSLLQGTLQKFVDDLFTVILSTSRPVPLAVKYFFDLLDDQAAQHGILDQETIHIWKTNRYRTCTVLYVIYIQYIYDHMI